MNCQALTTVHIPYSVTSIEEGVFDGCRVLTSIYIPIGTREKFKNMLDEELWDKIIEE